MIIYLEKQLLFNKLNLKDIYKVNEIKIIKKQKQNKNIKIINEVKNDEYKGIYFYSSYANQELESLIIYSYLTKNLPINCCFLYYNKDTNKEELLMFINRCILCKNHILFCMVKTELLNNSIKRYFLNFIKKISKNTGTKMESC